MLDSQKPVIYTREQADAMIGTWKRYVEILGQQIQVQIAIRQRQHNSMMARQLMALFRVHVNPASIFDDPRLFLNDGKYRWIHASRYLSSKTSLHPECAKLRFWRLIEELAMMKADGNPHCGYVRLTDFGKQFCLGKERINRCILTQNQGVGFLGLIEGDMINISEVKNFDYNREIQGYRDVGTHG